MSKNIDRAYRDIPGTYVFDIEHSQKGYHLNKFCYSLNNAECRVQFAQDEATYLDLYAMTDEQKVAVKARDFNKMLALGGNIYFLWKIAATMKISMQTAGGLMSIPPLNEQEFTKMLLNGGRLPSGIVANKGDNNG